MGADCLVSIPHKQLPEKAGLAVILPLSGQSEPFLSEALSVYISLTRQAMPLLLAASAEAAAVSGR